MKIKHLQTSDGAATGASTKTAATHQSLPGGKLVIRNLKMGLLGFLCAFCISPFLASAQGFRVSGNQLLDANGTTL